MLSENIQKLLNEHLGKEFYASKAYLAMASWCDVNSWQGAAEFLYKGAEDEREHMLKIFRYINDNGGHAQVPATPEPPVNYNSLHEIFKNVLELEMSVANAIHQIVEASLTEKDYPTFLFLQEYVKEQQQAEQTARKILNLFEKFGDERERDLFFVDKYIKKWFVDNKEE
ncbi:MAG: ferritin [Microscillaceae bacterium]|nr:ferritin [Microscillaceae bacterium]MDW8460018.1 ferritin [Cytophagales bacterium]